MLLLLLRVIDRGLRVVAILEADVGEVQAFVSIDVGEPLFVQEPMPSIKTGGILSDSDYLYTAMSCCKHWCYYALVLHAVLGHSC